MHYHISILLPNKSTTQNPTPIPCNATSYALCFINPLFIKAWFARLGSVHPILFAREFNDLLEGKSKWDMTFAGESKVLPRLLQRGFERVRGSLQYDSLIEDKYDPSIISMEVIGFEAFSTSDNIWGQAMSIVLPCKKIGIRKLRYEHE